MSLGIAFKGAEGIVLAADSRVVLTATSDEASPNNVQRGFYDNATKLLRVSGQEYVGVVTYGAGAIVQEHPRTAHSLLPEFESGLSAANCGRLSVEDFANRLSDFFELQWRDSSMSPNHEPMVFIVGGYNHGESYGRVYQFSVPADPSPLEVHAGKSQFGMIWGGQRQFADRLIQGFDEHLPKVAQQALELSDDQKATLEKQLKENLQAPIPFPFLPLQDSVDLSILLIRTTMAVQNWVIGNRGVGGPIDVATVTRADGFQPVQLKSISADRINW